jgi:hypothetical protein
MDYYVHDVIVFHVNLIRSGNTVERTQRAVANTFCGNLQERVTPLQDRRPGRRDARLIVLV